MSITITLGKAGRLVVPKAIRESLGLREGSRLRIEAMGGRLEATPEADNVRIEVQGGLPVIRGGAPRKRGDIVAAIKSARDERTGRILSRRKAK